MTAYYYTPEVAGNFFEPEHAMMAALQRSIETGKAQDVYILQDDGKGPQVNTFHCRISANREA